MKNISNKVLFKFLKKSVVLGLSINLALPFSSFAGQYPKTQDEVKILISAPDKYKKEAGVKGFVIWSLIVIAVGRLSYSVGTATKGLKDYDKGFEAGKTFAADHLNTILSREKRKAASEAFDRGFIKGKEDASLQFSDMFATGKKVGYNEGLKTGARNGYVYGMLNRRADTDMLERYSGLKVFRPVPVSKAELETLRQLNKQTEILQAKLLTEEGINGTKKELVVLMYQADKQVRNFKAAKNPEDIMRLRLELNNTIENLSKTHLPDEVSRNVLKEYVADISSLLKDKGGIVGLTVVGIAGAATLLLSSCSDGYGISNNRVIVQRELSKTFAKYPEIFAAKVLMLKDKYGLETVSSVLYENKQMLPLLQKQMGYFSSPAIRREAFKVMQNSGRRHMSTVQCKTALLEALKN